jgi:hypothetical protein
LGYVDLARHPNTELQQIGNVVASGRYLRHTLKAFHQKVTKIAALDDPYGMVWAKRIFCPMRGSNGYGC